MTRPQRPELFAHRPVRSDFGRRGEPVINLRRLFVLLALIALAVGVGIAINAFVGGEEEKGPEDIPVIKAEGPLKERPEQPGGLEVPHQDVTVFQKLESKGEKAEKPGMENLLPPPDTPQPVPEPSKAAEDVSQESPVVASSPTSAPFAEAAAETLPPAITAVEPIKTTEKLIGEPQPITQAVKPEKKEEPKKDVAVKAEKATAKPEPEAKKAEQAMARLPKELFTTGEVPKEQAAASSEANGKTARVQLASLPDQATAQSEAKRFQNKYAALLGGATLTVIRADLGAKGIYYRVMSAPLPETKAKAICADLAKQKASCLVVR